MLTPVPVEEAEDVKVALRSVAMLEHRREVKRQQSEYERLREVEELAAMLVQQINYGGSGARLVRATVNRLERKISEGTNHG